MSRAWRRRLTRRVTRLLWPLGALLLRLLIRSWRIRVSADDRALDRLAASSEAVVLAFWHSDLLACGGALYRGRVAYGRQVTGLVSRSADGDILARAAAGFGFRTIRGSSSRGGLAALRSLYRELGGGRTIVIAPDGPRGPARAAQSGVVQVAALAEVPIVPMAAAAARSWRAGSWDRTLVPRPFTRVEVVVGEDVRIERGAPPEREAKRLEGVLNDLAARAEASAGAS